MENDSFLLKLSKSKRGFIIIVIVLVSSIFLQSYVNDYVISEFYPDIRVDAVQLDYTPTEYIPFSRIESYVIQTISNSSIGAMVSYKDMIKIFELMDIYDTIIIEYDNNFYIPDFTPEGGVDFPPHIPLPFSVLTWGINLSLIISILFITIIVIIKILNILGRAFPFG